MRRLLPWLVAVLPLVPGAAFGEDPPKDPERAKKVEEAKRLAAEDLVAFQARVDQAIDRGVAWLKTQHITTGCDGNLFKPTDKVTRGAMAAFLYRLQHRV